MDGKDDYIKVPYSKSINIYKSNLSEIARFSIYNDMNYPHHIILRPKSYNFWKGSLQSLRMADDVGDGRSIIYSGFTLNKWFFAAGVLDYSNNKIYFQINNISFGWGNIDGAGSWKGQSNNNSLYVGKSSTTYFPGSLDEIYLFKRPLSPKEIELLYANYSIFYPIRVTISNTGTTAINLKGIYVKILDSSGRILCSKEDLYANVSKDILRPEEVTEITYYPSLWCFNKMHNAYGKIIEMCLPTGFCESYKV